MFLGSFHITSHQILIIMKEINDWEHQISNHIEQYKDRKNFPSIDQYHITQEDFEDYLFNKQAAMDKYDEDEKKKYTIWGILVVIPIVVLSFYSESVTFQLLGVGIGIVLCIIYEIFRRCLCILRLKRLYNKDIETYIFDIMNFEE